MFSANPPNIYSLACNTYTYTCIKPTGKHMSICSYIHIQLMYVHVCATYMQACVHTHICTLYTSASIMNLGLAEGIAEGYRGNPSVCTTGSSTSLRPHGPPPWTVIDWLILTLRNLMGFFERWVLRFSDGRQRPRSQVGFKLCSIYLKQRWNIYT